ncbi:MAG: twin-arginine translocase TatA/TatE family subunit [Planctomycetota bacterium]
MVPLLFIGGIGTTEILVILVIGLLIFGGRLPEVARSLGKSFTEFRRGMRGITDEIEREPDPYPPPRGAPRLPPARPSAPDPTAGESAPALAAPPPPAAPAPPAPIATQDSPPAGEASAPGEGQTPKS